LELKLKAIKNNNEELNEEVKILFKKYNLFRKFNKFSNKEKLISIKFISDPSDINYSLIIKNTTNFSEIAAKLYEKYPQYKEKDNFFDANGNKIDKNKTLEQLEITDDAIITLQVNN
jgi:uncharacterized coiled-coil DUF342 family protein